MIYIKKEQKSIQIPRYNEVIFDNYTLKLENNLTHQQYEFKTINVEHSRLMYSLSDMNFSSLIDGEYNYTFYGSIVRLSEGLITVGDYKHSNKQYESNNKFITYEPN